MKKLMEMVNDNKAYAGYEVLLAAREYEGNFEKSAKLGKNFLEKFVRTNLVKASDYYFIKQHSKTSGIYTERYFSDNKYRNLTAKELEQALTAMSYAHPVNVKELELIFKEADKFKTNKDLDSLVLTLLVDDIRQKYFTGKAALPSDDLYTFIKDDDGIIAFIPLDIFEENLHVPKDIMNFFSDGGSYKGSDIYAAYELFKKRNPDGDEVVDKFHDTFLIDNSLQIDKDLYYILDVYDKVSLVRRDLRKPISPEKAYKLWEKFVQGYWSKPGNEILNLAHTALEYEGLPDNIRDALDELIETYEHGEYPMSKKARYSISSHYRFGTHYTLKRDTRITPRKEAQ